MRVLKRFGSAVGLLFFVTSISFATTIVTPVPPPIEITAQSPLTPETFKLTYDAPNPPADMRRSLSDEFKVEFEQYLRQRLG